LPPQTLLIDADDTLWENNVYFERAIARFISFLNHHEFSPEQVREVLNDVERECIVTHGYGLHSFAHALIRTFERLSVQPVTPELHAQIHSFAHSISDHPVELLPEVAETLQYLAQSQRHCLILMTKGAIAEQSGKVERSGLKEYFAAVEIVAEKNAAAYGGVVEKYSPDCMRSLCPTATPGYSSTRKSIRRRRFRNCSSWGASQNCASIFRVRSFERNVVNPTA
jgi:putative hydrolase of the HAD superfamily